MSAWGLLPRVVPRGTLWAMAIRVRVLEKADGSFLVQRETAERSGVWQDDRTFTDSQEERALKRADRLYRRVNGDGNGDVTVYQVG